MTAHDDPWLRKARAIVELLSSDPDEEDLDATEGFSVEEVELGLLLSRRQHAIGIIRRQGEGFVFIGAGHREATSRASDVDDFLEHLAEVVAAVLRPHKSMT